MRRTFLIVCLVFSLTAPLAFGQGLRKAFRPTPAPIRPMMAPRNVAFGNVVNSFGISSPTLTRVAPGTFNPSTGAFVPGGAGTSALIARRPFQPVNGSFVPMPDGRYQLLSRQTYNPITNTFVPSPTGNLLQRTRGDFVPSSGSFANVATGTYDPRTASFKPADNGAFSLTSRGNFVPANGFFVPNAFGNFVLTSRQEFDASKNAFVPSPTGSFVVRTPGAFVPASNITTNRFFFNPTVGITTGNNPIFPNTPFGTPTVFGNPYIPVAQAMANSVRVNNAATNVYASNIAYTTAGFPPPFPNSPLGNPYYYWSGPWYPNPWNYNNPYLYNPMYGSYGTPPYTMPYNNYGGTYGSGGNYGNAQQAPVVAPVQANAQPKQAALGAFGVGDEWPLAIRMMNPEQRAKLLEPLEARLQAIATQAVAGRPNPELVKEAQRNLESLHNWLKNRRLDMAEQTFRDADTLLRRIDVALQGMREK